MKYKKFIRLSRARVAQITAVKAVNRISVKLLPCRKINKWNTIRTFIFYGPRVSFKEISIKYTDVVIIRRSPSISWWL